jgi:scyllo-inositol 2-dehydrogenase (NADP+)
MTVAGNDVVATVDPVNKDAAYTSLEDVPLDTYDAACVCTPDNAKFQILEYLLKHKKHVMVEKPLIAQSRTEESALQRLAELARHSETACYTAYNHRFEPHLARLKEVIVSRELGELYLVRGFYGNGTARDVRVSPWRDQGLGVFSDLGSHLLDLCLFLFGPPSSQPMVWARHSFENAAADHVLFGFEGCPAIQFEATLLSWRNTFGLDVIGERGSAHVDGLCKWGPSTFTIRARVFPSGKPTEHTVALEQPDPTWKAEYEYFMRLCKTGVTNIENDCWISGVLGRMRPDAPVCANRATLTV